MKYECKVIAIKPKFRVWLKHKVKDILIDTSLIMGMSICITLILMGL